MSKDEPVEPRANEGNPAPEPAEAAILRARLVDHLRDSGVVTDAAVERAMRSVPRHRFLPASTLAEAYADAAVPTHWQDGVAVSSASQPAIVALMLQQLAIEPGMRVLEIGAGTGYNAALLTALVGPGGSVTSVDIDPTIVAEAREHLLAANAPSVAVQLGDGRDGWPDSAPYDRILLTVGADDIWPAWREQLVDGGILVLPLELANGQVSVAFRKRGGVLISESLTPCGFMRLRGGEARATTLIALPDGRRLFGVRVAEIAESVAALLSTRPRVTLGRRLDAATLQRLGFSVAFSSKAHGEDDAPLNTAGRLVTIFPRDFNGRGRRIRPGVYAVGADGPSLALFSSALPLLFTFGGKAAERLIADALSADARPYAPLEHWRIEARPRSSADEHAPPADALRLTRPHTIFDIWPYVAPSANV